MVRVEGKKVRLMSANMQLVYTIEIDKVNYSTNESIANSWSFLRCSNFRLLHN